MARNRYRAIRGFSLIELLISIALGLIIVAAVTSLTVRSLDSSNDLVQMTRLEQELRDILQVMIRDLKRSGYMSADNLSGYVGQGSSYVNPFQTFVADDLGDAAGVTRCISYSYDRDDNGLLTEDASAVGLTGTEPQETFGFRFDAAGNAVELLSGPLDPLNPTPNQNCRAPRALWQDVSDPNRVRITDLRFIVSATNQELADTAINPLPPTGTGANARIIQRQLFISITGELRDDPSVTRTLYDSVKIRNEEFTPPS